MGDLIMFEDIFNRKKLVEEKLIPYGFVKKGNTYSYFAEILNGDFSLEVKIDESWIVDTVIFEKGNGRGLCII